MLLTYKTAKFNCRFFQFCKYSQIKFSRQNSVNMDKAYFRYTNGEENYQLSFYYSNPDINVNRQFNFTRQVNENVGVLTDRIITNMDKVLSKKKKKKTKEVESTASCPTPIDIKFLQNGEDVPKDLKCIDVLLSDQETKLVILDKTFQIQINAPWVTSLHLPVSILAGFPVYPSKFEGLFLERKHCKFLWYTSPLKNNAVTSNWTKVGEGFTYFTSTADIGHRLKVVCVPGNATSFGAEIEVMATNNIEAGPGFCPFENRHSFTKEKLSGKTFRVVSYNILADLYCDSDFTRTVLHPYCPPYALHIDYRKQLVLKEILGYNCDILCLQEVDSKVFDLDLTTVLADNSYEGIFSKKGGQVAEGLACFFRTDRFKLLQSLTSILAENVKTSEVFANIWSMVSQNEAFSTRLLDRTTVAQATVLQSLENENEIIVVGNTHLYFHPDADHVRLVQGGLVITWLNSIIDNLKLEMPNKRISLILCGDFNSVPSCGIYQLYTTGSVTSDVEDWKSNETEALNDVTLTQPLLLSSACGTPEYTNFTVGFADCLDYIYHDRNNLAVIQVVPFPSNEELNQHTALPSIVFPSDHIALIADLQFK